jgi:hemoglobin-like flavoprotein
VDRLDDLDSIVPAVEDLGRRHVGYGVQDGHYETVGAALLWALEQALGEAWTAEAESAWTTAYGVLSGVMCGAAREVEAGWGPSHFAQSPSPAPGSSRSGRPLRSERAAASPAA